MTPFRKMQGLGNDFVVFDAREHAVAMSSQRAKRASPTGISASAATRWS